MRIAYMRVSTDSQSLGMQQNALARYECEKVFTDEAVSGAKFDRPGLNELKNCLRPGDRLYIYSLTRLGRNTLELINLSQEFQAIGVALISHTENIDTSTPIGVLFFSIMAALAQFELEVTNERRIQGIQTARDNGVKFGRKARLTAEQSTYIKQNPQVTINEWMEKYKVSRSTITRARR